MVTAEDMGMATVDMVDTVATVVTDMAMDTTDVGDHSSLRLLYWLDKLSRTELKAKRRELRKSVCDR